MNCPWSYRDFYCNNICYLKMWLPIWVFLHFYSLTILKDIVDKTAIFVARNGQEFEAKISQNEVKNPKFNFLNPNDPYHNYYRHKVKEFSENKGQYEGIYSVSCLFYCKPLNMILFRQIVAYSSTWRALTFDYYV